jgi:hypothetical protein
VRDAGQSPVMRDRAGGFSSRSWSWLNSSLINCYLSLFVFLCMIMSVPQKRKHFPSVDFKQRSGSSKRYKEHGHSYQQKRPRYDASDEEPSPNKSAVALNGVTPQKLVNGYKHSKAPSHDNLNYINGVGEGSRSKNFRSSSSTDLQLQEQRKQLPIAKGMPQFIAQFNGYLNII